MADRVREAYLRRRNGGTPQFVDRLIGLMCDVDEHTSNSACTLVYLWWHSFSNKNPDLLQSIVPRLFAATGLGSPPQVKINAIRALGRLGSPVSLDPTVITESALALLDLIRESNHQAYIREAAILLLPCFGRDAATAAVGALIHALDDESADVQVAACSTLGRLGVDAGDAVRPLVAKAARAEEIAVSRAAVEALTIIDREGQRVADVIGDPSLLDGLIDKLQPPAYGLEIREFLT